MSPRCFARSTTCCASSIEVLTCTRGADAIKILEAPGPIHVVMSDQRMPGMTGVEVLHHARKIRPEATRLLFTAYADIRGGHRRYAINQGSVFHYITKPWEPDEASRPSSAKRSPSTT